MLSSRLLWPLIRSGILARKRGVSSAPGDCNDHYDIIIAGGGMVGCSLACALAKNPKLASQRILLLEGSPRQEFVLKDQHSNRVSALTPATRSFMEDLGAWTHIQRMRLQPVKHMQVWDGCSQAQITFNHETEGEDLAYIVENDVILQAVNEELTSDALPNSVDIQYGAHVRDLKLPGPQSMHAHVTLDGGNTYSCKLLVGADGAASRVRRASGARYASRPYEQTGLVATLELETAPPPAAATAWQRFLPGGPVALLPLGPARASLVWSLPPADARRLLRASEPDFLAELRAGLGGRPPRAPPAPRVLALAGDSRALFPLGWGHAARYAGAGVALVGDAAHRVHPLAGQGVNLGLGDAACLARELGAAAYAGEAPGAMPALLRYETERQRRVLPAAAAIDGLQRLYGSDGAPVVLARSLGLRLVDALLPLKRAIVNHAMS